MCCVMTSHIVLWSLYIFSILFTIIDIIIDQWDCLTDISSLFSKLLFRICVCSHFAQMSNKVLVTACEAGILNFLVSHTFWLYRYMKLIIKYKIYLSVEILARQLWLCIKCLLWKWGNYLVFTIKCVY